jgi:hypothetical protein
MSRAYELLHDLPRDSTVLLRSPRKSDPALFERNVAVMAETMGLVVEWFAPDDGGREQNYLRDFELVATADRVECFFAQETPMEGGTAHVVEAAITRNVPVYAWTIDEQGNIDRLGEYEVLFG